MSVGISTRRFLRVSLTSTSSAFMGLSRNAKGGTRTPIAFRLPDPKSGASASSATFAHAQTSRLQRITVRRVRTIMWAPMDAANPSARPTLTVVVPCYNEAAGIESFYRQVRDVLDGIPRLTGRIVFIDDGSTDGTLEKLNTLALRDPALDVY